MPRPGRCDLGESTTVRRHCPGHTGALWYATIVGMSYDLVVWQGARPSDDRAAAAEFQRLYDHYIASDGQIAPTSRIAGYVTALLERYPDIGTDAGADSPWSTEPLMGEACGPLVYFPMVWSRREEVSAWAAHLAEQHQLNCYDPQREQLRTPAAKPWRFELTSERGRLFHDPDADPRRIRVGGVGGHARHRHRTVDRRVRAAPGCGTSSAPVSVRSSLSPASSWGRAPPSAPGDQAPECSR